METRPYVVTNDLSLVFSKFEERGRTIPNARDIDEAGLGIRKALQRTFENVDIVEADRISGYLLASIQKSDLPVISLTGLLGAGQVAGSIECSRTVEILTKSGGFFSYGDAGLQPRRKEVPDVKTQFNNLVQTLGDAKEVALADDVIFSGGTIIRLTEQLANAGITVKKAYASLIIEDAIGVLADRGIESHADLVYEDVVDEVCMRDFIIGAPDGGRNVLMNGGYACAPYVSPFGDICKWASIPEDHVDAFSRQAVESSLALWSKMDAMNGASHLVRDLTKPVIFWQPEDSVSGNLKSILDTRRINGQYSYSL